MLSTFGPDSAAVVVPLGGSQDLASPAPMRIGMRDEYRAWEPGAWYVPVPAADAFDGLVHVRGMRPTTLLSQRPWLQLDGAAVEVVDACEVWDAETLRMQITFSGGSLSGAVQYDDDWVPRLDATVSLDGVEYTGVLPLELGAGWIFMGQLLAEEGKVLDVSGFLPYELPGC